MDDIRITHPPRTTKDPRARLALRLAKLEERHRNELMGEDERQELRDRILKLRRRLNPVAEAYEVLGVPPVPEARG